MSSYQFRVTTSRQDAGSGVRRALARAAAPVRRAVAALAEQFAPSPSLADHTRAIKESRPAPSAADRRDTTRRAGVRDAIKGKKQ